ncbi:zinc-dependent alcohol dehydrogenase family protein [Mycoplasma miroungirhinis]|uniref:Zinc-dependent alcohol dehydrogenase family protein n=2 Tax=Mycoplasma miroungirhinis TaxID=754516 RepID=A0A6M4JBQ6_9MOLU|nr:zinc-dependent alcohol dehydrogenase family protein [Mycoplasma miroungirhinis]
MKALVYHGEHKIALEEVDKPTLKRPEDAIVKIIKTTICGTDLGIYKGKNPEVADGRILGHEGIGVVEEVGSAVTTVKPGDKVLISCVTPCGKCDNCRKQLYSHCRDEEGGWKFGYMVNGTQAEYIRVPHANNSLYKYPDTISDEEAVMLSDALPTGHEIGVKYGQVKPGDTIAIVGAGPVGMGVLLTSQLYSPAKIIVIDFDKNRLKKALELGATHTLVPTDNIVEEVKKISGGDGIDVAIEAVGVPATWNTCQQIVKPGGHISVVGVHGKKVDFNVENLWIKNLTITTGLVNTDTTPLLINAVATKKLPVDKLVTHYFNLSDIMKAYETFLNAADTEAMKVLIDAQK